MSAGHVQDCVSLGLNLIKASARGVMALIRSIPIPSSPARSMHSQGGADLHFNLL